MTKQKEIIVFTYGDSTDIRTWSNVPFFFTSALEVKGYVVRRINIKKFELLQRVIDKVIRTIKKDTAVEVRGFKCNARIVKRAMRRAVKKYPNVEVLMTLDYYFSPASVSDKTSLVFSDWTTEYLIRHFKNRKPTKREQKAIDRQNAEIEKSDYVVTLFPDICDDMKQQYKNQNIHYLGNIINSKFEYLDESNIDKKYHDRRILFVGMRKYKESAQKIIEALEILKSKNYEYELDIVGMDKSDFGTLPEYVHCHGYLDKHKNKKEYYDILNSAKVCINTGSSWGGFSSMVEAMYYYTPVITAPYGEFVRTFGEDIGFGEYCQKNEPEEIAQSILNIMNKDRVEYVAMCKHAHNSVKDFTWDSYMDKILELVK